MEEIKTKTIAERLMDSFCLEGKITEVHANEIKAVIQSELERIAKRVVKETKKGIVIHEQLSKEIVGNNDYHIGAKEQSERLRVSIINIFKSEGIIK